MTDYECSATRCSAFTVAPRGGSALSAWLQISDKHTWQTGENGCALTKIHPILQDNNRAVTMVVNHDSLSMMNAVDRTMAGICGPC